MKRVARQFALMVIAIVFVTTVTDHVKAENVGPFTSTLTNSEGERIGLAYFEPDDEGVRVHFSVSGLEPNRTYEFNFHEHATCETPLFTSAGDVFNPKGEKQNVAGELPSIRTDNNGRYSDSLVAEHASLDTTDLTNPALEEGSSLVLQAGGERIACGVVQY
ncbi:superoxide dismutase family protein [Geomicrobium sediminis]|uniref:Cu-Zn family superoxide dismutase n=1 Tax=Geomicrobium sediminis TaxID=1347788 RepID=A0ABS2P9Q6_9BACL|nr:superoxide dismutase family protein [Geomicrobium sediminis]MBM7632115.1 Cu-Zn family superoxide dismutase [Geomicrobium sediminis]